MLIIYGPNMCTSCNDRRTRKRQRSEFYFRLSNVTPPRSSVSAKVFPGSSRRKVCHSLHPEHRNASPLIGRSVWRSDAIGEPDTAHPTLAGSAAGAPGWEGHPGVQVGLGALLPIVPVPSESLCCGDYVVSAAYSSGLQAGSSRAPRSRARKNWILHPCIFHPDHSKRILQSRQDAGFGELPDRVQRRAAAIGDCNKGSVTSSLINPGTCHPQALGDLFHSNWPALGTQQLRHSLRGARLGGSKRVVRVQDCVRHHGFRA